MFFLFFLRVPWTLTEEKLRVRAYFHGYHPRTWPPYFKHWLNHGQSNPKVQCTSIKIQNKHKSSVAILIIIKILETHVWLPLDLICLAAHVKCSHIIHRDTVFNNIQVSNNVSFIANIIGWPHWSKDVWREWSVIVCTWNYHRRNIRMFLRRAF